MNLPVQLSTATFLGLVGLGALARLRFRRKRALADLAFLTIFYVYLCAVLDYTLIQFQSLLLLRCFFPHLMLRGLPAGAALNLVPLITLAAADLKTSLLNILLFVPFGFGLPFISGLRMRGVVAAGVLVSLSIETLQFVTGRIGGITFRVADVNDVIFNSLGAAMGYLLFAMFARAYRRATRHRSASAHPIARYVAERVQGARDPDAGRPEAPAASSR
jgi:glycopeptide antibiotics resistance protein